MPIKSILIVDDDEFIRLAYKKTFAKSEFQVQTAGNAEEALAIMRQAPADVLFLDLDLPGMNGVELGQEIHRHWPSSILIAVTGFTSIFELVRCREAGFDDYFTKPVGTRQLMAAATEAVKKLDRWKELSGAPQLDDDVTESGA